MEDGQRRGFTTVVVLAVLAVTAAGPAFVPPALASHTYHQALACKNVDWDLACELWLANDTQGGEPKTLEVSPDGSVLYVSGHDGGYFVTIAYDAWTGQEIWRWSDTAATGVVYDSILSADGLRLFLTGSDWGFLTVALDTSTHAPVWSARSYSGNTPTSIALDPSGTRLYVGGMKYVAGPPTHYDYNAIAYDAATGTELWNASYDGPGHGIDRLTSIAVTPNGLLLAVGTSWGAGTNYDVTVVALDVLTGATAWVARYTTPDNYHESTASAVLSPDGSKLFVTGNVLETDTYEARDYLTLAFDSSNGAVLWSDTYNGPGGDLHDHAVGIAAAPDGSRVFVTGTIHYFDPPCCLTQFDFATIAYDASTGERLWLSLYDSSITSIGGTVGFFDYATQLALSPDGSLVFVAGDLISEWEIVAYDAATGRQAMLYRHDITTYLSSPNALALSPLGDRVFITGPDRTGFSYGSQHFLTLAFDATTAGALPVQAGGLL